MMHLLGSGCASVSKYGLHTKYKSLCLSRLTMSANTGRERHSVQRVATKDECTLFVKGFAVSMVRKTSGVTDNAFIFSVGNLTNLAQPRLCLAIELSSVDPGMTNHRGDFHFG